MNMYICVCVIVCVKFLFVFYNFLEWVFAKFQESRHVLGYKHILVNKEVHEIWANCF